MGRNKLKILKENSKDIKKAKSIGNLISTKYYNIEYSSDVKGVEVCSAIKNVYSMLIGSGEGSNTSSSSGGTNTKYVKVGNTSEKTLLDLQSLNNKQN